MTMFPTLNLPTDFPRWATDSGRVLEPSSGVKDVGWQIDDVPPARWMNWLQNLQYDWLRKITSVNLNNWTQGSDITANPNRAAIFHPDIGYWLIIEASNTPYYSVDGHAWTISNTLGSTATNKSIGIDTSYYIVSTGADLKYSSNAGATAWSTKTPGIGGSGTINRIHTKYPDSDYMVIVQGGGTTVATGYSSTGVTGTFTRSTTDPAFVSGALAQDLIYLSGTTWLLSAGDKITASKSGLFKSYDDGVNWTDITSDLPPISGGGEGIYSMAYNKDAGRLIITGDDGIGADKDGIWYSDDLGGNWFAASVDYKGTTTSGTKVDPIYYCGGGLWVGAMSPISTGSSGNVRFLITSSDNGETWNVPDVNGATFSASGTTLNYFACDERKVMCFGQDGFNISSLSMI